MIRETDYEEMAECDAASEVKGLKIKLYATLLSRKKFRLKILHDGNLILNEITRTEFWANASFKARVLKALMERELIKEKKDSQKVQDAFLVLGQLVEKKLEKYEENVGYVDHVGHFQYKKIMSRIPFTLLHPAQDFKVEPESSLDSKELVSEFRTAIGTKNKQLTTKKLNELSNRIKGTAYFGSFLYLSDEKGDKYEPVFLLINCKGEGIPFNLHSLEPVDAALDLKLDDGPLSSYRKELRWSPLSIKSHLAGTPETIDGVQLFNELRNEYRYFMDFPKEEWYDIDPIWVIGTYCFTLFQTYPYLFFGGFREVGKTKAVKLTMALSYNGRRSTNSSVPALFRAVQSARGSVGIDEGEKLASEKRNAELQNFMLGGWESDSYHERTIEKTTKGTKEYVLKRFENYCPKAIGNIKGLEGALGSRVLRINLLRTTNPIVGSRDVSMKNIRFHSIRDKLYLWTLQNWKKVYLAYYLLKCPRGLKNRDWQIWHPLLAIALAIDTSVYSKLQDFAIGFSKESREDVSLTDFELQVLEILNDECRLVKVSVDMYVKRIVEELIEQFGLDPRYTTPARVGRTLLKFDFSGKKRDSKGIFYVFKKAEVLDRYNRYIVAQNILEEIKQPTSATQSYTKKPDIDVERV